MKLHVKETIIEDRKYYSILHAELDTCMKKLFERGLCRIINAKEEENKLFEPIAENEQSLRVCMVIPHMETDADYDYEENMTLNYYEDEQYEILNFCPKCGERIEIIIEEVQDKTKELHSIQDKITKLNQKRKNATIRKELDVLYEELRKLVNEELDL